MKNLGGIFQLANEAHAEGKFDDAIKNYKIIIGTLIKHPKTNERQINLGSVYLNIGNSFKEKHDFSNADKYFKKALELYEKLQIMGRDCSKEIAWNYDNIASSYQLKRDFSNSLKFNNKALKIREKLFEGNPDEFKIDYLKSLYNISISYQQLSDRENYILSLESYIDVFENLNIVDSKAQFYYDDAKKRLAFAKDTSYKKLKFVKEIKEKLPEFLKKYSGFEPSIEECKDLLQEFRDICGGSIIASQKIEDLEQFYFRVRNKNTMKEGDQFNVDHFSYPPEKFTKAGRVNLSKHPVFYCGEMIEVVIKETHIQNNDEFYLSFWRSNNFYPKYAMLHSNKNNSDRMNKHKQARKQNMTDGLKVQPTEIAESIEFIFETLSELFTINDWTISSAIGYDLLYHQADIDGIEYPDAKTKRSYNFALKPSAAKKLELVNVYLCELVDNEIVFKQTGRVSNQKVDYSEFKDIDHPFNHKDVRIYKEKR